MKELDDISQEITQLQRYANMSPPPLIPACFPRLTLQAAEDCGLPLNLAVTSLLSRSKGTQTLPSS